MTRNMTEGKPIRQILWFFVPVCLGNIFQQFYNMIDTFVMGRFVSVEALAAVGSTGSLNFLILGFIIGLCAGFSIPVARAYGSGDAVAVRRCMVNMAYLSLTLGVVMTLAAVALTPWMLRVTNTPADIFEHAYEYLVLIFGGALTMVLYNVMASIFRALGNSRTPLYFLILSAVLHIVFDLWFVLGFGLGVAGVAWSTLLTQLISGVGCLIAFWRVYPEWIPHKNELRPDFALMGELLGMGLPMAAQFSITGVGSIMVQTAINGFGSVTVAAVTAASKVQVLFNQPLEAMGTTMATYCGQNLGAGRLDRIRTGIRDALVCSTGFALLSFLIVSLGGTTIVLLFINSDAAELPLILPLVSQYLRINGCFYVLLGSLLVLRNSLQGLGFALPAMTAGVFELVARAFVAVWLVGILGYRGICFANPAAWVAANLLLVPMFLYAYRKLQRSMPGTVTAA